MCFWIGALRLLTRVVLACVVSAAEAPVAAELPANVADDPKAPAVTPFMYWPYFFMWPFMWWWYPCAAFAIQPQPRAEPAPKPRHRAKPKPIPRTLGHGRYMLWFPYTYMWGFPSSMWW